MLRGRAMEILTFVIEGRGERIVSTQSAAASSDDRDPDDKHSREFAELLNGRADEIAQTIEREVRRLMPLGGITAQADICFYSGSIILEGSVALLCWAGRTALEPIRDELANVIKTVTRRAVNKAITALNRKSPLLLDHLTVDVTSAPLPNPTDISTSARPKAPRQEQLA
jgi:hypothetical protein